MPGEEADALVEVERAEWEALADAYVGDWPHGIYARYVLLNCVRWTRRNRDFPVKVYRPAAAASPDPYATFVIFSQLGGHPNLNMFTLEESGAQLLGALRRTQRVPWRRVLVCGVLERHRRVLEEVLRVRNLRARYELLSTYYWLPRSVADQWTIEVPPEVYIAELKAEDADVINSLWPLSYPGSEQLLRQLIGYNGGLGVFLKETGQICAWIMKNQFQGLGVLQTLPEFQGRGYAKLITKAMSKKMSAEGLDLHACILRTNVPSQSLFKGLGFQLVGKQFWAEVEEVEDVVKCTGKS